MLWGAVTTAIWLTATFSARRWRTVPSYCIGAVPYLVALYVWFGHLNSALPAY
jgi:hypothetical protein